MGGPEIMSFDVGFFEWWGNQIPMIEYFPYTGVDLRRDKDLILLARVLWDVICILSKNVTL